MLSFATSKYGLANTVSPSWPLRITRNPAASYTLRWFAPMPETWTSRPSSSHVNCWIDPVATLRRVIGFPDGS
ncbi:MAG TPA: hypothetical protein VNO30_46960 [Kofleriaceae bacterium]|nr:hypothetical protein [Kofleriaceae bacterium]